MGEKNAFLHLQGASSLGDNEVIMDYCSLNKWSSLCASFSSIYICKEDAFLVLRHGRI